MTVQLINTKFILPNPYQTRESEDPLHVKNLAMSIFEHTMLQIPSGRIAPGQQGKNALKDPMVQLAFGHSRLAAYKFLADAGNEGFECFPVNIVQLTDNQMFENAVAENLERKDLTPIEEARAMEKYQTEFHKTSKEVGDLFHLSDSAVRNKMRLLNLPENIQTALREGKMTEGAARELLPWFDLPDLFRRQKSQIISSWDFHSDSDGIASEALKGVTSERIHDLVTRAIEHGSELAKAPWKWDEILTGESIVGLCKGCAFNFEREGKAFCTDETCFGAKQKAWVQVYLDQASLLSGIQVLEEDHEYVTTFSEYRLTAEVAKMREARCENLRITYDKYAAFNRHDDADTTHLIKEGFPAAKVVCLKRSGFCTCQKAMASGIRIESGEGGTLAADELKSIDRARREQERLNNNFMDSMENKAAEIIYTALKEGSIGAWLKIAQGFDYGMANDLKKEEVGSADRIWQVMAAKLASQNRWSGDPQHILKHLNVYLSELGLEALPWEVEPEEPKGKSLTEVFKEEEANNG